MAIEISKYNVPTHVILPLRFSFVGMFFRVECIQNDTKGTPPYACGEKHKKYQKAIRAIPETIHVGKEQGIALNLKYF